MFKCPYCLEHKGIQGFHNDPEDMICQDCYDEQFNADIEKAFILAERDRLKAKLKQLETKLEQINLDELPFQGVHLLGRR